jgi:hypothetical protein
LEVVEPAVKRLLASAFSSSKLFDNEVPEGVLEPVREGDCMGESLCCEAVTSAELKFAFSPPVMASDIARRPLDCEDFLLLKNERVCEGAAAGEGEARPVLEVSLPAMLGEFAIASMLCESYASLVTVGCMSLAGLRGRTKSNALELRSLLMLVP